MVLYITHNGKLAAHPGVINYITYYVLIITVRPWK